MPWRGSHAVCMLCRKFRKDRADIPDLGHGPEDGMQALIDAYVAENPDVEIKLQVTSWDEYWTKMDAAAESISCRISSGCIPMRF